MRFVENIYYEQYLYTELLQQIAQRIGWRIAAPAQLSSDTGSVNKQVVTVNI